MAKKPDEPLEEDKEEPSKEPARPAEPAPGAREKDHESIVDEASGASEIEDGDAPYDRSVAARDRKPGKTERAGPAVVGTDLPYTTKSEQQREQTAAYLAYSLMAILALTIILQYIAPNEQLFNTLLPILSGLVGSAITYYFTKEARSS